VQFRANAVFSASFDIQPMGELTNGSATQKFHEKAGHSWPPDFAAFNTQAKKA
jgi:hypothetical protein